jgi:hypothetical protein
MKVVLTAAAILFATATIAAAQTPPPTPETLTNVYSCADIQADAERLRCYDDAVRALRQAQTQGQVVAVDREQARSVAQESFGFNLPSLSRLLPNLEGSDEAIENVQATVTRMRTSPDGYTTFEMEGGQVWTQVEPQSSRNVRVGDVVTIQRAALGSFRLISPRGGRGHRVRRQG